MRLSHDFLNLALNLSSVVGYGGVGLQSRFLNAGTGREMRGKFHRDERTGAGVVGMPPMTSNAARFRFRCNVTNEQAELKPNA